MYGQYVVNIQQHNYLSLNMDMLKVICMVYTIWKLRIPCHYLDMVTSEKLHAFVSGEIVVANVVEATF